MKNNKKTILITSIILGVLILTISLTYAVFSMSKTGQNSNLVVGDVYMHYANGNKSINLANVMPSETYDATSFFEFTIDGKNTTTNKDIWYEIILKHGDEVSGKTRIKDNLLKFTLTETKNGTTTTVFDGRSYNDLTNKRIWVNTINKNTTSEISITYRLYMWISNDTIIGNTDDVDYTTDEWKNVFASIKVDVAGDFNEKSIATDASCFSTSISNNEVTITGYDASCGSDVVIPSTINGLKVTIIDNGCGGGSAAFDNKKINKNDLNYYIQKKDNYNINKMAFYCSFQDKGLTSVIIPNTITTIGNGAFEYNQLTSVIIPDSVTTIEEVAFSDNRLTSVTIPDSVTTIGAGAFSNNRLTNVVIPGNVTTIEDIAFENNQLTSVIIPDSVTTIEEGAFSNNQLTTIILPKKLAYLSGFSNNKIENILIPNGVTTIGANALSNNQLSNITIPDSVTTIDLGAFSTNQLSNITIPSSVTTIERGAFSNNQLTSVTIGNGIQYIGISAFEKHIDYNCNPNLSKITINKSCTDIKNIHASSTGASNYYPWLSYDSPYTASGVTIYGSNHEVCDSF